MKRKLFSLIISLSVGMAGFISTPVVFAAGGALQTDACQGLSQLDTSTDCSSSGSGVGNTAQTVVNILSLITGIASVIMVIVSGFKYVTSGGSSDKTASAKSTLIYALIGIAITILAQFMVHYVINTSSNAAGTG